MAPSWGAPGREAAAAAEEAIIPPMRAIGLAPAPAAIAAPNMLVLRAAVALGSANWEKALPQGAGPMPG